MDLEALQEALRVAEVCDALEREGLLGDSANNPWEQSVRLRPILVLLAQPSFSAPVHLRRSLEICAACLLYAPQGCLRHPGMMLELLDSPALAELLGYLEWLEAAMNEVGPSFGGAAWRTVLVPQRVTSALASWPAECAELQKSATVLVEALLLRGPEHQRHFAELRRATRERRQIEDEQLEDCRSISRDMEQAAADFAEQLQEALSRRTEWQHVARLSELAVAGIQQLASDFLQNQEACCGQSFEAYGVNGTRAAAAKAAVCEARRPVRRHDQAFGQAARRFTEVASQLVAWTTTLVPRLRLLAEHGEALRAAVALRMQVPALIREHLAAEDDQDAAQTELRKYRRHAQAAQLHRPGRPKNDPAGCLSASSVLDRQYELRVSRAGERAQLLAEQLREAQRRLHEAEAELPLELDPDEEQRPASSTPLQSLGEGHVPTPEERLALKLASLEQYHEQVAVQVSEVQVEHDRVLNQVAARKEEEALRRRVEPDFICPITHERMSEPVLAADGHSYERQAIEKWLQKHNTSPMTGAPLAHRYLTANFALRHLIKSCEPNAAAPAATAALRPPSSPPSAASASPRSADSTPSPALEEPPPSTEVDDDDSAAPGGREVDDEASDAGGEHH